MQVQTLVKELRRIALLWDELWLGTLAQLQSEIRKRQQQLEYEIEKVNDNANLNKEEKASLIIEKHRIIVKPIVYILEQLEDVIKVKAETPYEQQFQQKYLADIQTAIGKMKKPENPENPQSSLLPLKVCASSKLHSICCVLNQIFVTDIAKEIPAAFPQAFLLLPKDATHQSRVAQNG